MKIKEILLLSIFFLSLFILIGGAIRTYAGIHNVDLGMNMMFFEEEFNASLTDIGSDFQYRTPEEVYILGLEQIKFSVFLLIVGGVGLGFGFIFFTREREENLKRTFCSNKNKNVLYYLHLCDDLDNNKMVRGELLENEHNRTGTKRTE